MSEMIGIADLARIHEGKPRTPDTVHVGLNGARRIERPEARQPTQESAHLRAMRPAPDKDAEFNNWFKRVFGYEA